jgi:hypothetical protein
MYFAKFWKFAVAASFAGAFILLTSMAGIILPILANEELKAMVVFLTISILGMAAMLSFVYVAWIQKCIYFFRLKRLLNENVTSVKTAIEYYGSHGTSVQACRQRVTLHNHRATTE